MFEMRGAGGHNHRFVARLGDELDRGLAFSVDLNVRVAQLSNQPARCVSQFTGAIDSPHPGNLTAKLTGAFDQCHLVSAPRSRERGPQPRRPGTDHRNAAALSRWHHLLF